jgi:uncharacterized protein (DUF58 family)
MNSGIEVKASGRTLILSAPVLLTLYALFQDTVILYASLLALLLSLCALISAVRRVRWLAENLRVKPGSIGLKLTAGDTGIVEARIEAPKPVKIHVKHPLRFCTVKPQPITANSDFILEFTPNLAGSYSSDELDIEADVAVGLFKARVSLPFKTDIAVIPRIIPAAIRALELIGSTASPGGSIYEYPLIHRIGRGTEYAETREYTPGDEFRRIDWKATARLQKLMIKHFHEDVGGEVNLIFDLKTAGPVSMDAAAAEFLDLATALSAGNIPYRITIIDEENRIETLRFDDWRHALLVAVRYALASVKVDYTYLYDVIGPQSSRELILLAEIAGFGRHPDPSDDRRDVGWMDAIAVTCLIGDLTWLIDIWDEAVKHSGRLIVHTPSKIWLDSPSLEEAYMDYQRQARILKMLRKRGVEVEVY